jgi:RHS repeat-associated protein
MSLTASLRTFAKLLIAAAGLLSTSGQANTVTYFHNDLLGSPTAATNQAGQVVWREAYHAYGERKKNDADSAPNKVWYTSRHQDEDTGLVYMGARYYEPAIGRFLSTDAVGFHETNIHSFNRYAYANNNPYKFVDPDGNIGKLVVSVGKVIIKGGDIYSTVSGLVENGQTIASPTASTSDKLLAGLDIAADLVTGFNSRDVKAGVEAAKGGAASAKQAADLSKHLGYAEKYGKGGVKELENGRIRYYGEVQPANKAGEMAGRRYVHEYDAVPGRSRGWHETVDQAGNVRQVRPELNNGSKTHYQFDRSGNYTGSW